MTRVRTGQNRWNRVPPTSHIPPLLRCHGLLPFTLQNKSLNREERLSPVPRSRLTSSVCSCQRNSPQGDNGGDGQTR